MQNLHEKARAEVDEANGIQKKMDQLVSWTAEESQGETSTPKRGRSESLATSPPASKKTISHPQDVGA